MNSTPSIIQPTSALYIHDRTCTYTLRGVGSLPSKFHVSLTSSQGFDKPSNSSPKHQRTTEKHIASSSNEALSELYIRVMVWGS